MSQTVEVLVIFGSLALIILALIAVVCFITAMCQIYSNRKTINSILNHLNFNFPSGESMIVLEERKGKE